jgi:ParB-like chromosome segregation protein Spo0J
MEADLKCFEAVPPWAVVHPVVQIYWIPLSLIEANDYNPNVVAPPEMALLEKSIEKDGFTQPVVLWFREDGIFEIVDGFHRYQVARKKKLSHIPGVVVNRNAPGRNDRMASTIRHNRARGKHQVAEMAKIVTELRKRNWNNEKIALNLGMEPDEVLRLSQIGGLAELFQNREFSEAWE